MKHCNIVIKFDKEAILSRTNEALTLKDFATQNNFLNQFTYRSIVTDEMLSPQKKINTINFENLVGICYVQGLNKMPLEEKKSLAKKMDACDVVEYAYVEISQEIIPCPEVKNKEISTDKASDETPNYSDLQTYKDGIEKDHIGIDMEYAWSIGVTGKGIKIADIGIDYNPKHINLQRDSLITLVPLGDDYVPVPDPGTSVTGILYANDVGFGVKGMVHGADNYYFVSEVPLGDAAGIAEGLAALKKGDVFVYELQTEGPTSPPESVSIDYDGAVWDVTHEALKAGILVVAAGGDSSVDLDRKEFDEYRNRPDNGIIRVGAGDKLLSKASFSNHGSMIHLQAWGDDVVTTGYGDLHDGGPNDNYTATFSGTSSATPIVASAVVAVQSWYKESTGKVLSPLEMRQLLIDTGTAQADPEKGHIGPIPNIKKAIETLKAKKENVA